MIDWNKYLSEKDERKRWDMLKKDNRPSYDHIDSWLFSILLYKIIDCKTRLKKLLLERGDMREWEIEKFLEEVFDD